MIVAVACETCGGAEVGRTDLSEAHAFTALLLLCHTDSTHMRHVLHPRLIVDADETSPRSSAPLHDVSVRCVGEHKCTGSATWNQISMQEALFRLLTYHTNHEGHALSAEIDGKSMYTPSTE